jgi:hypothetical protein
MKCYECGGEFVESTGDLDLTNRLIGKYTLNSVCYGRCGNCGEILLPDETWTAADIEEGRIIKERLEKFPISEFISASEVADILGISKQALHKHQRIKNGFIFSVKHNGRIEYHKKSVEMFKEKGDGRFPLFRGELTEIPRDKIRYLVAPKTDNVLRKKYTEIREEIILPKWFSNYPRAKNLKTGSL